MTKKKQEEVVYEKKLDDIAHFFTKNGKIKILSNPDDRSKCVIENSYNMGQTSQVHTILTNPMESHKKWLELWSRIPCDITTLKPDKCILHPDEVYPEPRIWKLHAYQWCYVCPMELRCRAKYHKEENKLFPDEVLTEVNIHIQRI
jgi:hypothetical protein